MVFTFKGAASCRCTDEVRQSRDGHEAMSATQLARIFCAIYRFGGDVRLETSAQCMHRRQCRMVSLSLPCFQIRVLCVAVLSSEEHGVRLRNKSHDAEVLRFVGHDCELLV